MPNLTVDGLEFSLLVVPRGEFLMGSRNQLFGESPPHVVRIGADFLLGEYPVTQQQWQAVMGDAPSTFTDSPNHPVDSVSWDQAVEFCERLSDQCRRNVRLPSEAQWEYACRAGTTTDFFFGSWGPFLDESEIPIETRRQLDDFAWFDLNSCDRTQPVGLKKPNPWGFHDMIGNVWEWCADVWHSDYDGSPLDGRPWIDNVSQQPRRALRGGAWDMNAFRCRSSYRSYDHKDLATSRFGFRIAVDAE